MFLFNSRDTSKSLIFKSGSIHKPIHQKKAAVLIKDGNVIGLYNRGVNALLVDAANHEAVNKLVSIKGEQRRKRPLALCLGFEHIKYMIDLPKLAKSAREFLELTEDLKSVFGSLCFLRLPIKEAYKYALPDTTLFRDEKGSLWIQNWDPHGYTPTDHLLKHAKHLGVFFPGITSMNYSGKPEIVIQQDAEEFCKSNDIAFYLKDHNAHVDLVGSYTIITFNENGIELTREGNIPGKVLEPIIGYPLIVERAKPAKYAQMNFPECLFEGLTPVGCRLAILLYLEGKNPIKINQSLLRNKQYRK